MAISFLTGAAMVAGTAGIWAFLVEPRLLRVRDIRLQLDRWPRDWSNLRVAILGDLQVGAPWFGLDRLARVVERVNSLEPDLVLLLGDYLVRGRFTNVSVLFGRFVEPAPIARRLSGLRARYGTYAVLGNHDWYYDGHEVRAAFEAEGVSVLENEAAAIDLPRGRLWLAGLADCSTRTPDIAAAFARVPEDEPVVVMTHDPALFPEVPSRALITLAGHTHGGQVRIPGIGAIYTPGPSPLRHALGHIRENGKDLYVTGGLGTTILPLRFNMPPEFAMMTLASAGRGKSLPIKRLDP